jgi:hypothetical protein
MQQRRLRLGDILDDYCPRERRVTNHVVVAMIEDEVKQTRCTTCDADHEYKQARVPASRRKKPLAADATASEALPDHASQDAIGGLVDDIDAESAPPSEPLADSPEMLNAADGEEPAADLEDEGPVHRPLIRATLPRPEGQAPERKAPDFTMRQPGRFDHRGGQQRQRGRPMRHAQKQSGGQARFGGPRHGADSGAQGGQQRQGNRSGNVPGQRSGRPQGSNRGPKPGGGGHGRKRGR